MSKKQIGHVSKRKTGLLSDSEIVQVTDVFGSFLLYTILRIPPKVVFELVVCSSSCRRIRNIP
jgi:hypothetical protein